MSSLVINHLPGIEDCSYLELGIRDNKNFDAIQSKTKFSVDLNGLAMFTGTTDDYFKQLPDTTKFDLIFIDACHDYEYVVRDFNNSVTRCNKWIMLHDMIPPAARYTDRTLCSDSFKVLYYMLNEEKFSIYPMNENFGFTLIRMPAKKINPAPKYANTTYDEFTRFMSKARLYSESEIKSLLENENV